MEKDMPGAKERGILRALAHHQAELAHSDANRERVAGWYRLNECEPGARPMIHLEMGTFEQEVIPRRLRCETPRARELEVQLYRGFLNFELFDDDMVVRPYFPVHFGREFVPFGLDVRVERTEGLGHRFVNQIENLEREGAVLGPSRFAVRAEETLARKAAAEELFGDILPVRLEGTALYAVPTQDLVHLMGMENMYVAMLESPGAFLAVMERLADDYIAFYRYIAGNGWLLPTAGYEGLPQGSLCFNRTLPASGRAAPAQVCGFLDSQETVSVSPAMFKELIFPAYQRIAREYGWLSYGCCEPVHAIWDSCLSALPNLRKVSVSPWCDQAFMGRRLRGRKTVFHRKPSPNFLGVDVTLDEDAFRAHIRQTLEAARGCTLEFTQRDVYTIHSNEAKARRYVRLIRREIEDRWKP